LGTLNEAALLIAQATSERRKQKGKGFPMSQNQKTNSKGKQVAVVVGATSKWQSDGRNTLLAHGRTVDDSGLPVGARWGVGGAIAQKFAQEGFFVVLTTRKEDNASALAKAIGGAGR
jgi:NAD(P)-dependent dehydrogenase (short-subunit alcohol dehydrogenase family)